MDLGRMGLLDGGLGRRRGVYRAIWREVRVIMGRLGRDDRIMGRIGGRGWVKIG